MGRPTNKQRRIKDAKDLLECKTLQDMFDEREAQIVGTWKSERDPLARERLHIEVQALSELKDYIYATANDRTE